MLAGCSIENSVQWESRLYQTMIFMAFSTLAVSTGIIVCYTDSDMLPSTCDTSGTFHAVLIALLPYMICAVLAAITAIAVMTIWPSVRCVDSARQITMALNELGEGDLSIRVRLEGEDQLRNISGSLNTAVNALNGQVAQWKVLNRRQWGALCLIRYAVEGGDSRSALEQIALMERNWDRIAEIENRLIT